MTESTAQFKEIVLCYVFLPVTVFLGMLLIWKVEGAIHSMFMYFRKTFDDPEVSHNFKLKLSIELIFMLTVLIFAIKTAIVGELVIFIVLILCDTVIAVLLYYALNLPKQKASIELKKHEDNLAQKDTSELLKFRPL